MLEGALHVSGPQLGACLQRYGSSLQQAVAAAAPPTAGAESSAAAASRLPSRAPLLGSPERRGSAASLTQEEAVCLATPMEPAPVRDGQRLPTVPRLPTTAAAAPAASAGPADPFVPWRGAGALALDAEAAAAAPRNAPVAAALRRLGRRAGLSPNGARALLGEAVGAGATWDAANGGADEIVACRRTVLSIATRVSAAHAARRERRRLVLRARRAARGLLAGALGGGGRGGKKADEGEGEGGSSADA